MDRLGEFRNQQDPNGSLFKMRSPMKRAIICVSRVCEADTPFRD